MIKIDVRLDIAGLKRQFAGLERKIDQAAAAAINRTAEAVRTEAVRAIAAETSIKQKDVRKRIYIRRASKDKLIAYVDAYPYAPNIGRFAASQKAAGVSAKAWARRKIYRHSFLLHGRAVVRVGRERFPLKGLRGPSVRRTFMQRSVIAGLQAVARQTWRGRIAHEIKRRLQQGI